MPETPTRRPRPAGAPAARRFWRVSEAAEQLGVNPKLVRAWCAAGTPVFRCMVWARAWAAPCCCMRCNASLRAGLTRSY